MKAPKPAHKKRAAPEAQVTLASDALDFHRAVRTLLTAKDDDDYEAVVAACDALTDALATVRATALACVASRDATP